ncbi:hypothetical protein BDQ17DRAFT_1343017 [Cyathus striatus]|nr:hypothetical protein BDQ17DRAFT_1343017 [Cyathus striatus]
MTTVEFVTFEASKSYLENPTKTITDTVKWVAKEAGFISAYYGVQTEDKNIGHIVIVWETYEHHDTVMKRADYNELLELIKPCLAAPLVMQHVPYVIPNVALESPTTELATFRLKDSQGKELVESGLRTLSAEIDKKSRHPPSVWNEVREKPGSYILAIGWDSKVHHEETVKAENFQKIIGNLLQVADISLIHVDLKKFTV